MRFLFLFLTPAFLFAQNLRVQSELEEFLLLEKFVSEFSYRYTVEVIDDFETGMYFLKLASTFPASLQTVFRTPLESKSREQQRAFELESLFVGAFGNGMHFQKSLSFRYYVEVGGRNHYKILRKETKKIKGTPYKFVLWLYSDGSGSSFHILFRNTMDGKEYSVPAFVMKRKGWVRVEKFFPYTFMREERLNKPYSYLEFSGFSLLTVPGKQGYFELLLDNFYIVVEKYKDYPGNEYLDSF